MCVLTPLEEREFHGVAHRPPARRELKKLLRLRAARSGRSVEDEVRTILREAADATERGRLDPIEPAAPSTAGAARRTAAAAGGTKRVLLIIGGGIAAYKSLDLIRRLKERGIAVRCMLTKAAEQFVTPLSAGAIVGERVFTDLFDPASEFDVGHIRLARETDLIVVAPATADLMAKLAGGHADDLATAVLLATDSQNPAGAGDEPAHVGEQRRRSAIWHSSPPTASALIGPNEGEMAEAHERGVGRMAEPLEIAGRGGEIAGSRRRAAAQRQARVDHVRSDPRADRSGALYRQPLLRQAGSRYCRSGSRRRRRCHAGAAAR